MMLDQTTAAVVGAILGPAAALFGTKVKEWLATRDVRGRAEQLMKEASDLLDFADKVEKSAGTGGVVTKLSAGPLESLHTSLEQKIAQVAAAVSPQALAAARQRRLSTGFLGRVLLSRRPRAWWGWILHALYYAFLGVTVLFGIMVAHDYYAKAQDREYGAIALGLVAIVAIVLNLLATAADRRQDGATIAETLSRSLPPS